MLTREGKKCSQPLAREAGGPMACLDYRAVSEIYLHYISNSMLTGEQTASNQPLACGNHCRAFRITIGQPRTVYRWILNSKSSPVDTIVWQVPYEIMMSLQQK